MEQEVYEASLILQKYLARGSGVGRAEVMAYASLWALTDHWPSKAGEETDRLLEKSKSIPEAELDRCLKQRRIAIARLARAADLHRS